MAATLVAAAFMAAPIAARAQSPLVVGQFDRLGRFAGDAPYCQAMGYTLVDPDGRKFAQEIARIADRVGVKPEDAQAIVAAAKAREDKAMQADWEAASANLKDPGNDARLRDHADARSVKCNRAASDAVGSILLAPPVSGGVTTLSRRFVDALLAPMGRAGWQTLYVRAAGDIAQTVGACETRLTRAQAEAYLQPFRGPNFFPPDVEDRGRAYLADRRKAGRDSAAPTAAQCHQTLARQRAALENLAPAY